MKQSRFAFCKLQISSNLRDAAEAGDTSAVK